MAEVQRRLETVTLEVEELTQTGIFTDEECKQMIKKLFEHENKINSMQKSLEDFKDYISYIVSIYRLIKIRRNSTRIADKKHNIEFRILRRISNVYKEAITRFGDVELFINYLLFCKEANYVQSTKKLCDTMLKLHRHNEKVWLTVAQATITETQDLQHALKILQDGLTIHQDSEKIYNTCIKYEVARAKQIGVDKTLLNATVQIYVDQALKYTKCLEICLSLLKTLNSFKDLDVCQKIMYKYVIQKYPDRHEAWQTIAERAAKGIVYDFEKKSFQVIDTNPKLATAFRYSIPIYKRGLEEIAKLDERKKLCDLYIDCLVKGETMIETKVEYHSKLLLDGFERASEYGLLDEKHYFTWLDMINNYQRLELLRYAVQKLPQSKDLWLLLWRMTAASSNYKKVLETFDNGRKALQGKSGLPLWNDMFLYLIKRDDPKELLNFFKLAVDDAGTFIREKFQKRYLCWIADYEGISRARYIYSTLAEKKPYSKMLHMTMLHLEKRQPEVSEVSVLDTYHRACHQIGEDDAEIWTELIKFVFQIRPYSSAMKTVADILIDAHQTLRSQQAIDEFNEQYDEVVLAYKPLKIIGTKKRKIN